MSGGNQQTLIVGRWARTCRLARGLAQVEEQFLVVGRLANANERREGD